MARRKQEERQKAEDDEARVEQLLSSTRALYEEMDKLNKKAPTMTISQLSLERVNKTIAAVKVLLADDGDDFVDEINEFVAAGDMPEYRDVVLVLSQYLAGLGRFERAHSDYWRKLRRQY